MNWLNQRWLSEDEMDSLVEIERDLGMCGVWEKPDDAHSPFCMTMDNPCFDDNEDDLPF